MTEIRSFAPHLPCPNRPLTTGSWRTFRPIIDQEKCNMCLLCWIFCPDGAMKQGAEVLEVDLDFCKGCGICAQECHRDAISMVEEG